MFAQNHHICLSTSRWQLTGSDLCHHDSFHLNVKYFRAYTKPPCNRPADMTALTGSIASESTWQTFDFHHVWTFWEYRILSSMATGGRLGDTIIMNHILMWYMVTVPFLQNHLAALIHTAGVKDNRVSLACSVLSQMHPRAPRFIATVINMPLGGFSIVPALAIRGGDRVCTVVDGANKWVWWHGCGSIAVERLGLCCTNGSYMDWFGWASRLIWNGQGRIFPAWLEH